MLEALEHLEEMDPLVLKVGSVNCLTMLVVTASAAFMKLNEIHNGTLSHCCK